MTQFTNVAKRRQRGDFLILYEQEATALIRALLTTPVNILRRWEFGPPRPAANIRGSVPCVNNPYSLQTTAGS